METTRKKLIFINSSMGLISQVVTILFTFITRTLFIKYIGVELLGLNSTFTSILSTLSMAELGFESAIVYSLYRPLHDKKYDEINDVMNIFKLVYRAIGLFFILASIIMLPFLRFIITDFAVSTRVYVYFILQAIASACTYFLAYKRVIIFADRKDYICKFIDTIINIIFNLLQCWVLIVTQDYMMYLVLKIVQVYSSNIVVHVYCTKHYSYLVKGKVNFVKLKEILSNVKNIFVGKIAQYIYQSTDNLVISIFVGTISVGYFVNYSTLTKSLKNLTVSILNPLMPFIGNFLASDISKEGKKNIFLLYSHVRYLIAMFIIIPLVVLIDDFIVLWVGADMVLARAISVLLAIEYYIDLVHSSTVDFINGAGLFKYSKYISIIGAITNLFSSLIFVQFWGIAGVLAGTIVSQIVFWCGRSIIVYFKCMKLTRKEFAAYWLRNVGYVIVFLIGYCICTGMYKVLGISNLIIKFICGGIVCELILIILVFIVFNRMQEQQEVAKVIKRIIRK